MTVGTLTLLKQEWRLLTAATLGWALDAFDMTIVFFLIPHLGKVFDASLTELAFVATMTGVAKVFGGIAFGKAADKYGRKLPFMVAVVWFCAFAGLSGLAWSYASFFFMRIMFGIGFGGEWATATALLTESLPKQIRSLGSGLMMAGYNVGSLLAGAAYAWLFPSLGWRWMFFIGAVPALLAIFVRKSIPESPEWLATKAPGYVAPERTRKLNLNPAVIQGFGLMAFGNFTAYASYALYPTLLTKVKGLDPAAIFPLVAAHTIAGIISFPLGGYLAKRFGERRMLMIYTLLAIPTAVLFVLPEARLPLFFGSLLLGFFPGSIWGIVPSYLSRRFTAEERSFGLGVAGAFNSVGNFAPTVISMLAVTWGLGGSMLAAMIAATTMLLVTVSFNTDRWIIVPEDRHEQLNKNFVSAKADAPI